MKNMIMKKNTNHELVNFVIVGNKFVQVFKDLLKNLRVINKLWMIKTTPLALNGVLYYLNKQSLCLFKQLQDMTCIDKPSEKLRFTLNYTLYSIKFNTNIIVSVQVADGSQVPSVTTLFNGADWLEREIFDLNGIFFTNHPNLGRLLTDYGFQGHPLRKDFPVTGFLEVFYNDECKRITFVPVELAQESRNNSNVRTSRTTIIKC
jgi:NADH:ubiquinone oxidoreductase subunit C